MKTKLLPLLLFSFAANAADLATTFSSTYSKVTVNNTITYTGSVVNKGTDTASNVQLIFYMPPKNVTIGNLPSGCSSTNIKISCSIGGLNVGDSATRTVSVFYTKKGGAAVSVNAITDSYDTNYNNNFIRLTTNVTTSTNTANSALIPNLASAKASPTSILQGNALTFTANLDAPLPSGYSVIVNYDGSNYTMNGSGTNYSLSNTPNNTGLKTFRAGVYDSNGNLRGSEMTGTFEVTKPNNPPTLSLVSGADSATAGTAYTLQLKASDADGNLSNIQITNWGDGSTDYQNATNNSTLSFTHTFANAGSYTISAIAYDSANASSTAISKIVNIAPPKYTKIANNGSELPPTAQLGTNPTDWACTKDNNTGRIWEVKTDNGGLRDKDWRYSWYEPDASKNRGFLGVPNEDPSTCEYSECDTYAFTNAVNAQGLCGANDWRMPTKNELYELSTKINPTFNGNLYIDAYFPNTNEWFWSSSIFVSSYTYEAIYVGFIYNYAGYNFEGNRNNGYNHVRLVR
jgi:uncharacterized repeat protein (TIGR01451 family)